MVKRIQNLTEKEKKIYKIFQFSKRFPAYGAKKLANVKLPYYQQDMLRRMWYSKYPLYLCSRRTGKTFIVGGVGISLKAALYEKMKIGIIAPVYRQSQNVFKETEKVFKSSPFLSNLLICPPRHNNAEWRIDLKNGSEIICIPLSDNIRSYGFNVVVIDEYGFREGMNDDVEAIIEPFLFTKRELKTGGKRESTDIGNQLIIMSTANYEGSDFHAKVLEYNEEIKKNNKDYDIISYDYRDGLNAGIFEEKLVLDKVEKADSLTRDSEYLNIFISSKYGFISYDLINNKVIDKQEYIDVEKKIYKEPDTKIELKQKFDKNGDPINKYLLIFDDADQGNDNFCYAIFKIDGRVKKLVQIRAINRAHIKEKVRIIRKILRNFNIVQIGCDQRHKNITDALTEKYYYSDGTVGNPIIIIGDKENQLQYIKNQYGDDVEYKEIIKIHNFSAKTNEIRARHLLSEMEKGRVKFPAMINIETREEEIYHNEIRKAIAETVSIRPHSAGSYIQYKPAQKNARKDRWTVTELGVYLCDEYLKESHTNNDDIYLGGWRH